MKKPGRASPMTLEESFAEREQSISAKLREKQFGINDRTGKGMATESIVETELLRPFLPPGFDCGKGAVVSADKPTEQSGAIDRIIFDKRAAAPLVYDPEHSVFPIEMVAGMVEITMHLDTTKLRADITRMHPLRAMKTRRFVVPKPGTRTRAELVKSKDFISPRSFIVGLPADPAWDATTIAQALRQIQLDLGPPTHVHGLYVLGVGFFYTIPVEKLLREPIYRIGSWTGPERLIRFADEFRRAFDRWESLRPGHSVDLSGYLTGQPRLLAE
jgi:hypothetical protein